MCLRKFFFFMEIIGCSISFLDLFVQFLPQGLEILSYYFSKYTLCSLFHSFPPGRPTILLFVFLIIPHSYHRVSLLFKHLS